MGREREVGGDGYSETRGIRISRMLILIIFGVFQ